MKRWVLLSGLVLVVVGIIAPVGVVQPMAVPIPTMAYYYIWYDTSSWNRAKIDYPLLGRYSSDDRTVMEEHVRMAQEAGIDGFIVSWKSTYALDSRLEQLMAVAAEANFSLWIIYQGLDFDRQPQPVDLIINDLNYFVERYASDPVFGLYDLPVVILSGTWEFSAQEVAEITNNFKDTLYVLATERNVEDYQRLASKVDGNAYYWSSVDPTVDGGYQDKLAAMGEAVHEHNGLWIAPAAPGFDARLIGGTRIVERRDGQTLREEMAVALRSNPDVIGIISWNEFSENTHIEPSEMYGSVALDILANRQTTQPPRLITFDSSAQGEGDSGIFYQPFILLGLAMLVLVSTSVIFLNNRRV